MNSILTYAVDFNSNGKKFDDFFTLLHETQLPCTQVEKLCREFCLFVNDRYSNLIIVATTNRSRNPAEVRDDAAAARSRTLHSLPVISTLDDYSFWLVQYDSGKILDQLFLPYDHILLNYHTAASVCGRHLAITSIQHQIVRIYHINSEGKFILENAMGPCFSLEDPRWYPGVLVGLKQRLIAFLYSEARTKEEPSALYSFHSWLNRLLTLAIWKAQYFDRDHMIIKLGPSEQLSGRVPELPSWHCLVVWHIESSRVVRFISDSELAVFYEDCRANNDIYRFGSNFSDDEEEFLATCSLNFLPTSANSAMERHLLDRTMEMTAAAKGSSVYLAKRRLASAIPYSSQVMPMPASPFFDSNNFRYDDRIISPIDRIRSCTEGTMKMFSRHTGRLIMKLTSNSSTEGSLGSGSSRFKKYSSWLLHPHLPLAISTQQSMTGYTCNLHYHSNAV